MISPQASRGFVVFTAIWCVASFLAPAHIHARAKASIKQNSAARKRSALLQRELSSARQGSNCAPCAAEARRRKQQRGRKAIGKNLPCHSKGYLDPKIRRNYQAAVVDMKRARLKPKATSYWRSSADQARLHRCSRSRRCRLNTRPLPGPAPGQSVHDRVRRDSRESQPYRAAEIESLLAAADVR